MGVKFIMLCTLPNFPCGLALGFELRSVRCCGGCGADLSCGSWGRFSAFLKASSACCIDAALVSLGILIVIRCM